MCKSLKEGLLTMRRASWFILTRYSYFVLNFLVE